VHDSLLLERRWELALRSFEPIVFCYDYCHGLPRFEIAAAGNRWYARTRLKRLPRAVNDWIGMWIVVIVAGVGTPTPDSSG